MSSEAAPPTNMLLRGLSVLEGVAGSPNNRGVGVTEIAAGTGLDKSTASRILACLRDAGYIRQDVYRRYRLTGKLGQLAAGYSDIEDLRIAARPHLERLHEEYDEEVHLAVIDGGEMVFIDYIGSSQLVRTTLSTTPRPVHLSAAGRAVLALMPEDERRTTIALSATYAQDKLSSSQLATLLAQLDAAHARGWADYESGDGASRFAAAVVDSSGAPIASLCISGPTYRLADRADEFARAIVAAAGAVTEAMQHGNSSQ